MSCIFLVVLTLHALAARFFGCSARYYCVTLPSITPSGSFLLHLRYWWAVFRQGPTGSGRERGSRVIPALTYDRQRSSTFALLSVHFRCSGLARALVEAMNPWLLMTASVTSAIVRGNPTTFPMMSSINNSRDSYRRVSTPLCWAESVSSTDFVSTSSTWKWMPVIAS